MTIITCKPIGVIRMYDNNELDEKIIAVAVGDPSYKDYDDIDMLPKHIFEEMMHFFEVYKTLEHKVTSVKEICHKKVAIEVIHKCMDIYTKKYNR